MQFEIGHHAPLSVIIDKHWDRLKYTMRDDYSTTIPSPTSGYGRGGGGGRGD